MTTRRAQFRLADGVFRRNQNPKAFTWTAKAPVFRAPRINAEGSLRNDLNRGLNASSAKRPQEWDGAHEPVPHK